MNHIDTILFEKNEIPLRGRNLILTGNNGSGKTYFLNKVRNHLAHNKVGLGINLEKENTNKLIELLEYTLEKFQQALKFSENNIYLIEQIIHRKKASDLSSIYKLKNILESSYKKFLIEKEYFFKYNQTLKPQEFIIKTIEDPNLEQYFHYYSPEFLENTVNKIIDHINKIIQMDKKFALIPTQDRKIAFNFFDSSRVPSLEKLSIKVFQSYEHLTKNPEITDPPNLLEAYLISIKKDINNIISNRSEEKGHTISMVNEIQKWFLKVENDLKYIFENDSIELSFSKDGNEILINLRNRKINYSFEQLSSGFKAIFYIYSYLLMRAEREKISPEELSGITIIDEIDVHLHISLQKKILPFLIKSFPKMQFIVSTHSPFVITSTNNDTVVYDISSGEFFEEDLSLYSHESIIKELFHVKDDNENLNQLSDQLLQFINSENSTQDLNAIQSLLDKINKDFEKLSVDLQLQYMVAKNKLAKLKHEGH